MVKIINIYAESSSKSQSSSARVCGSKEEGTSRDCFSSCDFRNNQHTESSSRSQSSSARICGSKEEEEEEASVGCFSSCGFGFWKRKHNTKRCIEVNYNGIFLLPDEILEMCLNRLPPKSLKNARLVCKRWSSFIMERRLLRMKNEGRYQNLWLFVFGTLQYSSELVLGHNVNKIHALDLSRNEWHDIDADFLKGRFMFSVVGIRDGIFIVGGRSNNKKSKDDSCFIRPVKKTHKDVMFFNPVTKSRHKIHSMKYARCVPILGVTENPIIPFVRQRRSGNSNSSSKGIKKRSFLLIVVGGFDDWSGTDDDSLMYCGEMYDSLTNKWSDIQSLPSDFGSPYSGIVCGKMFYVVSRTYKLAAYDIEKGFWFEIQTPSFAPNNKPPYEPKLVSSNGRILLVSNRWPAIRKEIHNLVTTLWEFDLMHLTWTEISTDPDVITDWRYIEFVANKNMIFGVTMPYVDRDEILDDFIACDVSESNRAKWINISSKVVHNFREPYWHPKCDPFWTRSMTVIHVSI